MKTWLPIFSVFAFSACATPKAPPPKAEYLKMANGTFVNPSDGSIFRLALGKKLNPDTGGITPIPKGIVGERQATASFYSVEDLGGGRYASAESSIAEGSERLIDFIDIQHEPSSGRILLTEDTSDALPCKRYILFTPTRPGYSIDYLAPDYEINSEEEVFPSSPPEVILLPEDRVWVGGKIIPISRITKSKHPFSLGG